jgi:hypothetical protein
MVGAVAGAELKPMRNKLQLVLIVILLGIVIVPRACSKKPPSQEQREQAFKEMMNGVTLAGRVRRRGGLHGNGCHRHEREGFLIQHVGGCTLSCC